MSRPNELQIIRARVFSLSISLIGSLAALSACGGEDPPQGAGGAAGSGGSGGGFFCFPGETEPCYTGPVATKDVGACRTGERTCSPDGSGYGVCVGEVQPVPDDCATPEDEDCDGVPGPACLGANVFGLRFGGTGDDEGRSVAFDAAGNLFATGSFEGSIDFGGGELKSAGGKDMFVVKLGPAGEHIWSKVFGDKDADQVASSIAVGADGSAVITGNFAGSIDFGGGPLASAGGKDVFVVKLTADGDFAWAKAFGGVGALQEGLAVAVDNSGNALVAGAFDGPLDVDGSPLVSAGGQDAFVAKLAAATGGRIWSVAFSGPGKEVARAVAADGAGNVLVGGGYDGVVTIGADAMPSAGGEDAFFVKLGSADGAAMMSSRFGGALNDAITGIATHSGGGYVLAGYFEEAIGFEAVSLQSAGARDIFVASYSAPGEIVFAKAFGDKGSQIPEAVAADSSGAIVIAGRFDGSLDLGHKPPLPGSDAYDIFVGKLDASGGYVYGYAYGGTFDQVALGVAVDSKGNAAVTGSYFGSLQFGADPLPSAGQRDVFIAKLAP
jgi:hypothetical protein